jgi:glycosyltransferase involved in cell wall biosynthesis
VTGGPRLVLTPVLPAPAEDGPRLDVVEIARALGADVLAPGAGSALGRRARRLGYWGLAWEGRRAQPELVVSLAEKVGMAFALADRARVPHVVVAHHLTSPRRRAFQRRTGWLERVDRVVVLAQAQARYLLDVVGLPEERVRFVYDKVDHRFFTPPGGPDEGYVLAVGRSRRDYATLVEAMRPLAAPAVILPSSPWLSAGGLETELPAHVRVLSGVPAPALRDLYDRASVVVVPLEAGTDFAAGVNAVLEAMAMAKALVVSDVPGIRDYVVDGETAVLVPAGDAPALRLAVADLLAAPERRRRIGAAGRAVVDGGRNLDGYVAALTAVAEEVVR